MPDDMNIIKELILTLESIPFRDEAVPVDCKRLDADSEAYDFEYERSVRRPELNLLHVLEKMLGSKGAETKCSEILYALEETLFSTHFYRDLLFGKECGSIKAQYARLCDSLSANIELFKKRIPAAVYRSKAEKLAYLYPPASQEEFLACLDDLRNFLLSKKILREESCRCLENA